MILFVGNDFVVEIDSVYPERKKKLITESLLQSDIARKVTFTSRNRINEPDTHYVRFN